MSPEYIIEELIMKSSWEQNNEKTAKMYLCHPGSFYCIGWLDITWENLCSYANAIICS